MSAGEPGGAGYKPARCSRSAPFRPRGLDTNKQFASPRDRVGSFSHDDGSGLDDDSAHCRKRTRDGR